MLTLLLRHRRFLGAGLHLNPLSCFSGPPHKLQRDAQGISSHYGDPLLRWLAPLAGCAGSLPAVMLAIMNALEPLGVTQLDMPATSEHVWQAIRTVNA